MNTSERQLLVLLHGLGQTPQVWQDQVPQLPPGWRAAAPWLRGLKPTDQTTFTLAGACAGVDAELVQHGVPAAHLCGISVGAMVALQYAVESPAQVRRLVLVTPQVRPPRSMLWLQRQALKVASSRRLATQGIDKARMQQALQVLTDADFSDRLPSVTAPTLVVCGADDRANLPAARLVADQIPNAELMIIPRSGQQPNVENPEEFNKTVFEFLTADSVPDDR